jgi:EAL domain-containing protein (putative c-di-GMP-specific phosphodiesterase class I)
VVRDTDAVARQGGDEFLFLLADLEGGGPRDDPSDAITRAETAAERIRAQLARPFRFMGTDVYVSASIGIAIFPFHAADPRTLLRYADVAMYASKRSDPGSTRVFSGEDPVGKLSLATRIRKAVEDDGFVLHYQPIVNLADGRVVGSEALLRWPQPDGSIALPGVFLSVVEEMGLIGHLGEWVLEEVCAQARRWQDEGASLFTSWNLSLPQLWQRDLAARILRTIHASGVDAASIVIEMAESAAMSDPERTRRILEELHDQGLGLAIDDFGTGYSSLSRLKDLPVDILKIDRPFLAGLPDDHTAAATVRAIVQLADGLGMRPLAEGIEQEPQRTYLLEHGCAIGQGFLFAKALPAAQLSAWLRPGALLSPGILGSPG